MTTSDDHLSEAIVPSVLPTSGQDDPQWQAHAEKREFPRTAFRGRAKAIIFPPPTCLENKTLHDSEIVTSDVSRGGVSILCRTMLAEGQLLMLLLNDKPQLAQVRWCCLVWDGLFAAGCKFHSEAHDIDIDEQLTAIDVVISSEAKWCDANESDESG